MRTSGRRTDLARVAADLLGSILSGAAGPPVGDGALFRTVQKFIHDNLGDVALTPNTVAAAHHVSLRYLHLLFEGAGITPSAFIRQARLAAAERELVSSGSTVTAVSHRFGFNDTTTFTRAFRRQFGTTPLQWRRAAP